MNFFKVSYFLPTLFMILIFSNSPTPASSQNLYERVCRETGRVVELCFDLLKHNPQVSSAKNYHDLSTSVLELALTKGTQGQNVLLNLFKTNPYPAISECANIDYAGTIASLKSAIRELDQDLQSAQYHVRVAGDGSANCDKALKSAGISNPTISIINEITSLLCQVAFLSLEHVN